MAVSVRNLFLNAAAAGLYAALTLGLSPLSYGPLQVRLSECMTLLAFYDRKWVPGLTAGCLLANLGSPFGVTDMAVGTAATFLAVYGMRFCSNVWQASLLPVLSNGILIGLELAYLAAIPGDAASVAAVMAYIGAGEFLAVTAVGTVLFRLLLKNPVLRAYIGSGR